MMHDMGGVMGSGMMLGMGLIGLLAVLALVLVILAAIKYLRG